MKFGASLDYNTPGFAYAVAGPLLSQFYAQSKSNHLEREYYQYQKQGYERQLADWHRNVPNRQIRYPELSYEGRIRGLDYNISQSYLSDVRNTASFTRNAGFAVGGGYRSSRSLYGQSSGRSSRYL